MIFCVLSDGKVQNWFFNTVFEEKHFLLTESFTRDLQPSLTKPVQYRVKAPAWRLVRISPASATTCCVTLAKLLSVVSLVVCLRFL